MTSSKEMLIQQVKSLHYNGPNDTSTDIALESLYFAATHYSLDPRAIHIFVLVTEDASYVS